MDLSGIVLCLLVVFQLTCGLNIEKTKPENTTLPKPPELLSPDGRTPCICGVFLSGQIKPRAQPTGYPLVINDFEDHYICNSIGIRRCQTKCVEQMVQYLSGSAGSACVLLDRDAYKERAHLFVKNCDDQWHNTRLSSGRELCCKDKTSYICPL